MANKKIKVRGIVSCAGLWGALAEGEERELDLEIAESLFRAGYAEPLPPTPEDENQSPFGSSDTHTSAAAPPRRKSRRAKES
jgi:hypothetical protein